jgi:DNA-binding NarL/FixJ family response regulator
MDRKRILIVDDHPLFRCGIRSALRQAPEFEVAGEAASGDDALRRACELVPDLVLCDVELPDTSGIEIVRKLKGRLPTLIVVLMSEHEDEDQLFEGIRLGAAGFLRKTSTPEVLVESLRRAAGGESLLDERALERPMVASHVLRQFRDMETRAQEIEPLLVPLSAREIEILDQIAQGNSNKRIAQSLTISDQTVKNHISSILRKLAVNDRTQAVVLALRQGWIQIGNL